MVTKFSDFSWSSLKVPQKIQINSDLVLHPFQITIYKVQDLGNRILVKGSAFDIKTGALLPLETSQSMPTDIDYQQHPGLRTKLIRRALLEYLEHEMNECLRFTDGTPVKEPHP